LRDEKIPGSVTASGDYIYQGECLSDMKNPAKDHHGIKGSIPAVILLLLFILSQAAYSQGEGTGQTWLSGVIEIPLSGRLKALLADDSRYNETGLYYQGNELTLLHRLSGKADLEAGYNNIMKINNSKWVAENTCYGGIIFRGRLGSLTLSDRNRFEKCNFCYDTPDYMRYRNKFSLSVPGKISPYVADEIFYTLEAITRD
jgi:hypothetical protein